MGEWKDAEEILHIYDQQTERQIIELNKIIVGLRARIYHLEQQLQEAERVPIPKSVIRQIVELEHKIRKQEKDIEYYRKFVAPQVIINKENKEKPTRRGGIPK